MNSEQIMKSDVLDILFEKRNKLYGAYNLRKFYNERLIKSIAGMLGLLVVFISFSFIEKSGTEEISTRIYEDPTWGHLKPPEKKPLDQPVHKAPPKSTFSTQRFTSSLKIVPDKDSTDKINTIDKQAIGSATITAPTHDGPIVGNTDNQNGGGTSPGIATTTEPAVDVTIPIENPEVEPVFPGGMEALRRFLQKNLTNPREMEEGETVSVKMKFVVGFDGKLQRFETIQDGGAEFNNEVLRVFKRMPEWIPGKSKGRNVAVYYVIPIKFVSEK